MNYQHLLEKAQDHVLNFYKRHDTSKLIYHNAQHTQDVAIHATRIANHYQLDDHDFFIVLAAAWFHDIGYLVNIADHEAEGAKLATEFFAKHEVDEPDLKLIKGCIMATRMPQSADTLPEQILCDADLFHLGTDKFNDTDKALLKEYNLLHHTELDKSAWHIKGLELLEGHSFYTDYCKLLLDDNKAKNIEELKKKVSKSAENEETPDEKAEPQLAWQSTIVTDGPEKGGREKKKNKNKEKPEKGIETMFRISSSNHQRLSDMADQKAHIMITVNSIILSAIISLVLRRLNEYGYLIIPSFILLTVSLLAMTFSILSTRPTIPNGISTKEDIDKKRTNLLFFGNFYKITLDEFNYGMDKMMADKDFLYGSLIRDLYAQGVVLGKKYRLLRIAYNIFMFGLIVAVLAFIIAVAFFSHNPIT